MADLLDFKGVSGNTIPQDQDKETKLSDEKQLVAPVPPEIVQSKIQESTTVPTSSNSSFAEKLRQARVNAANKARDRITNITPTYTPIRGSEDYEAAWARHLEANPQDAEWKPLLDRIAKQESNFKSVQNYAGAPAYGYYQLWETNLGDNTPEEVLNNPDLQISLAMRLLRSNLSNFTEQDIEKARNLGYSINAMLGGAWLGGVGGVRKYLEGVDTTDAHHYGGKGGSSVGRYFNIFNFEQGGSLDNLIPIKVGENEYFVKIAKTSKEKQTGLSNVKKLPENEGMLFIISDSDKDWEGQISFVMDETSIPLDIIYLDGDFKVVRKRTIDAFSDEVVYGEADYVLEVNAGSSIKLGDELEFVTDTDNEVNNKMLVLGPNGETQMTLDGGERIMSIKDTKILIKFAKKSEVTNNDNDYKALGKRVFKFLDIQNSNEKEYV